MTVRYAAGVVAMAVIPLVACSSEETVRDPGVLNPPAAVTEQPNATASDHLRLSRMPITSHDAPYIATAKEGQTTA